MTALGPAVQMPASGGSVAGSLSELQTMPGTTAGMLPPNGGAVADMQPANIGNDLGADFLRHVDGLSAGLRSDGVAPVQEAGQDGDPFARQALRAGDPSAMSPPTPAPQSWTAMQDVVRQAEQEMRADMTFSVNANMLSTSSQSVGKTRDDLMKQG